MKVLIIDDDTLLIDIIKDTLEREGFAVCTANDGLSGIESMITEEPDLVLLDIMMPGMDGYEVCKKLKESQSTAGLPIVFISAKDAAADIKHALSLGADDYIIKPFDALELGNRLNEVFKRVKHKKADTGEMV